MEYILEENVGFRINTRFSKLIGRNLISNPVIALMELVKNAYDADANSVIIQFKDLDSNSPSLIITDDGFGMSKDDILEKWLMVGTDNKVDNTWTPNGRRKLGEKGIGRFAVERLSRNVTIRTTQENSYVMTILEVNWDRYEKNMNEDHSDNGERIKSDDELKEYQQNLFTDILHPLYSSRVNEKMKGTEIILTNLRDIWSKDDIDDLKSELNSIMPIDISKFSNRDYSLNTSFTIDIQIDGNNSDSGNVELEIGKFYQAYLSGEIFKDGTSKISIEIKPNISASRSHIRETYEFDAKETPYLCGPVNFEAFIFLRDKRLYRSLSINKDAFNILLDKYSGVKIYRDGFRVMPYGDAANDWLELNSKRASSPEFRVNTKSVIGIVNITKDDNPALEDVLSRENLYDSDEFEDLKVFINSVFDVYTRTQLKNRNIQKKIEKKKNREMLDTAKISVNNLNSGIDKFQKRVADFVSSDTTVDVIEDVKGIKNELGLLAEVANKTMSQVRMTYDYYKKQNSFKEREVQIYRNIATLGISGAMFGHEAIKQTNTAKAICMNILSEYESIINVTEDLRVQFNDMYSNICLVDEKADFFRTYLLRERQDTARNISIAEILNNVIEQHRNAFNERSINVDLVFNCNENELKTWAYSGDFDSIFTNYITNAYKALIHNSIHNKNIRIETSIEDDNIIVVMENNGKPIELKNRKSIFDPMFSTYNDGTGLGMTIIQDSLDIYGGSIELLDKFPLTCFKITIPIKMGEDI